MENKKKLTPKQQYQINQVAATMAIENMPLSKEDIEALEDIATGKKTVEQSIEESIEEIKKRYSQV